MVVPEMVDFTAVLVVAGLLFLLFLNEYEECWIGKDEEEEFVLKRFVGGEETRIICCL